MAMEIYLIDVREFLLPTVSFLSSEEANRYQRYVHQEDKDLLEPENMLMLNLILL